MRKLLKRWYVWLGLLLLLGLAGTAALFLVSQTRITQANFDRIQKGMTIEEVEELLGKEHEEPWSTKSSAALAMYEAQELYRWEQGRSKIIVTFQRGKVRQKLALFASPLENLRWYAKKGGAKIGINWD
jgi:hypothetical protein